MGNTKSIFSGIRHGYSYLNASDETEEIAFRKMVMNSVRDFVYSGCYTKYRNKELFLEIEDLKDEEIARRLSISVGGVRQARKRISEDAYACLGYNVIDKILYESPKTCASVKANVQVMSEVNNVDNLLFNDVISSFKDNRIIESDESYPLSDCRMEMLFLRLYTKKYFGILSSFIDTDKLDYVLRLLDGEGTADQRMAVLRFLVTEDTEMTKLLDHFKIMYSGGNPSED